jgi:hypothetical protein
MLYTYKKVYNKMDGKYFYEMVNSQLNMKDRKTYLSTLTEAQKTLYTRYNNKVRQEKFKANEENKEKYNKIRKEHITELRKKEPERMREQNIKDVRAFRERERAAEEAIIKKEKSKRTLTDAIKAYKAKKELKALKTAKETAKPKDKKTKAQRTADALAKKREYMRKYRAEQKAKENKK